MLVLSSFVFFFFPDIYLNSTHTASGERTRVFHARLLTQRRHHLANSVPPNNYAKFVVTSAQKKMAREQFLACMAYNIPYSKYDLNRSSSMDDRKKRRAYFKKAFQVKKNNTNLCPLVINNREQFLSIYEMKDLKLIERVLSISSFEFRMKQLDFCVCTSCKNYYLIQRDSYHKTAVVRTTCSECSKENLTEEYFLSKNLQPVYYNDDGIAVYDTPCELNDLTIPEKLLIQRVMPYVPILHLSKGNLGMRGHCVPFEKEIDEVCTTLPNVKCEIITYIRTHGTHQTPGGMSVLKIRREKVLQALRFLKQHSVVYADVSVSLEAADTIPQNGNCTSMSGYTEILDYDEGHVVNVKDTSVSDCHKEDADGNNTVSYMGVNNNYPNIADSVDNEKTISALRSSSIASGNTQNIYQFPAVQKTAVSDYNESQILVNAFPWLFPGGIADFWESCRGEPDDARKYACHLLKLYTGCHEKDKFFAFFLLNKIQKRENSSSGGFFLKSFLGVHPPTLEDLQQQIADGDTSFISKLQYFSQKIRGSDGYWRMKKYELKTWIDYHIMEGHGPPTLFMTFSCAENWWIDLQRLLSKRVSQYDETLGKKIKNGDYAARFKAARDHPLLVIEFFQKRVQLWFETIGKDVFKIKYWWGRYEFAPGRGQIHLHTLCIAENLDVMQDVFKLKGKLKEQSKVLAKYARDVFEMTAEHPGATVDANGKLFSDSFKNVSPPEGPKSRRQCDCSLAERYTECRSLKDDAINLTNSVQLHKCNDGCLRTYGRCVLCYHYMCCMKSFLCAD